MTHHFNQPRMTDEQNQGKIRRYVHQPLTIEHYGVHASIHENGKVSISKVADDQPTKDEVQYDEVEIPASLIFKLASLLKATRTIKYVSITEARELPSEQDEKETV
jgi:hypothetical protein